MRAGQTVLLIGGRVAVIRPCCWWLTWPGGWHGRYNRIDTHIETATPTAKACFQACPPVSPKRLAVESPWSQFTSECQRF
jgi:hypothetical protein|eukprot:SAG25_NODE_244_length_11127_cov_82.802956_8_plen_80_part_00